MGPSNRKSLPEQVAEHLKGEILAGCWHSRLPGYRTLEQELKVSGTTLRKALQILTEEGILRPSNGWSRRWIARPGVQDPPSATKHVIVVGARPLESMSPPLRDLVDLLFDPLTARGRSVEYLASSAISRPVSGPGLPGLFSRYPGCRWILLDPHPAAARWFALRNAAALLVGGEPPASLPLPVVAEPAPGMLFDLVRRLLALGHDDIVILVSRNTRPDIPALRERIRRIYREADAGYVPSRVLSAVDWNSSEELLALLERIFRKSTPSALIVPWSGPAASVAGFCATHGIHIPGDLSLLVDRLDDSNDWHRLPFTGYRTEVSRYLPHILQWLERENRQARVRVTVEPVFVEGATLARANPNRPPVRISRPGDTRRSSA